MLISVSVQRARSRTGSSVFSFHMKTSEPSDEGPGEIKSQTQRLETDGDERRETRDEQRRTETEMSRDEQRARRTEKERDRDEQRQR